MKFTYLTLILLGFIFAGVPNVSAMPIVTIDQQNSGVVELTSGTLGFLPPTTTYFGQSFTPSLSGIDTIDIMSSTSGVSSTVRVDLYTGGGTAGLLLASTNEVSFMNTTFEYINFDFVSTQLLNPGDLYTMAFVYTAGDAPLHQLTSDLYAGGIAYDAPNANSPAVDLDFIFREGLHAAAPVPEPTTFLLMGIGLAGLAGAEVRRRRKNKAVDID